MRIHGIHVQGLRAPAGRHRLQLDPTYNVILTRNESGGMALGALLSSFLYPRTELGDLELWRESGSSLPSRAGLVLSFGGDIYRLIVDLDKQRMVLGRYVASARHYERVSTNPLEIEACLRGSGLPSRDEFMTLQRCPGSGLPRAEPARARAVPGLARGAGPEPDRERARLVEELERVEGALRERETLEARLVELQRARDGLAPLDDERRTLLAQLEERAAFGSEIDEVDARLGRLREVEEELTRERTNIEQSRRELLEERTLLNRVPTRQTFPLWVGVALALLGSLAGFAGHSLFYLFGPLGAATVVGALFVTRNARRRMGTVEACLAALRVRERAVERNFEAQSAPVRELLERLSVNTLEELAQRAADYRAMTARVREVEEELNELRRALPEKLEETLAELEAKLAAASADLPEPAEIREKLAQLPAPRAPASIEVGAEAAGDHATPAPAGPSAPDQLIRAAALAIGRPPAEIGQRLTPVLEVYLRVLSEGRFVQAERREIDGWLLRSGPGGQGVRYDHLSEAERSTVELAFRLSILEAIAPALSVPLILTPELRLEGDGRRLALARALQRLGSALQVIQITVGGGGWIEHASLSQAL